MMCPICKTTNVDHLRRVSRVNKDITYVCLNCKCESSKPSKFGIKDPFEALKIKKSSENILRKIMPKKISHVDIYA